MVKYIKDGIKVFFWIKETVELLMGIQKYANDWVKSIVQEKIKKHLKKILLRSLGIIAIYITLIIININTSLYVIKLTTSIFIITVYLLCIYEFIFKTIPEFYKAYKIYNTKINKTIMTLLSLTFAEIILEKSLISLIGMILIMIILRLLFIDNEIFSPIIDLF